MRIPSAEDYFGLKIPEVYPSEDVSSMRQRLLEGAKRGMPDIEATKAFGGLAGSVFDAAIQDIEQMSREKALQERKKQQELEAAKEKKERSELELKVINYKGGLSERAQRIFSNEEMPFEERWTEFEKTSEEFKAEFLKDVPEDRKYVFEPVHAEAIWRAKQSFADVRIKRAEDEATANVLSTIETLERKAAVSDKDRTEAIVMLQSLEMTGFSEKGKGQIIQEFKERTAETRLLEQLNEIDAVPEHQKAIEGYKAFKTKFLAKDSAGNYLYLSDLDPKLRQQYVSTVQGAMEGRTRQAEAEVKAQQAEWKGIVKDALADYKEKKLAGFPILPEYETRLFKLVKGTEYEEDFEEVKKQGEDKFYQSKKLAEDPLRFGAAQMSYKIEPLNLANASELMKQLKDRMVIASRIKAVYALPYAPVLTTDEAKGLSAMVKAQDTGSIQTFIGLTKVLGKDVTNGIAAQVSAEDPMTGMLIGYSVRGDTRLAEDISKGVRILQDKAITMPKDNDLRESYDDRMGDAMAGLPIINNTHYNAFKAYYAELAVKNGVNKDSVKKGLVEDAFRAVVGETVKINGKRIVAPYDYSEARFLNNIKRIDAKFVNSIGGVLGMSDADGAELIRDEAQWYMTDTPNLYRVMVKNKYLVTKDGKRPVEVYFPITGIDNKSYKLNKTYKEKEISTSMLEEQGLL